MTEKQVFEIEYWPIEKLRPYEKNAKKHPPEQIKGLAKSLKRLGFSQPIIVDADGVIIAGHGRRLASIENKWKKVPVICRRDLSRDEANALRLADNKMASIEYDTSLLSESLAEIEDFELVEASGFTAEEYDYSSGDSILEEAGDVFADEIGSAVEEQRSANEQAAQDVDERAQSLARIFGFSKVSTGQARRLKAAMTSVEQQTGKSGADALISFFDDMGF